MINMSLKLFFEAMIKIILGILLVGLLIFLPAGTFDYFNGWLLMGILFIPMFIVGIVMMIKSPDLLKRRLETREKLGEQKTVIKLSGLMFIVGFILAGLDFRYSWLPIPSFVSIIGSILFIIAYLLYAEVLRENAYLSRTIKVEKNQKVIDKGLYGIVRHPMYMATLILFFSMPLVLESIISFLVFLIYPFIIIKRLKSEEIFLEKELIGYKEYKEKVKYRLIPFIW